MTSTFKAAALFYSGLDFFKFKPLETSESKLFTGATCIH